VARLVGQAEERQREKATSGKGKPGHGGELGRDKAGRSKATYNISIDRQDLVRKMAKQEEVSQADIVEAAVVAFHNAWEDGQVDLDDFKAPTRSLKVMWELNVPDEFSVFPE